MGNNQGKVAIKDDMDPVSDNLLIDVRSEEEFNKSHIQGAINIPYEEFKSLVKMHAKNKSMTIKVYDHAGIKANKAAIYLKKQGFKNTTNLGGIRDAATKLGVEVTTFY